MPHIFVEFSSNLERDLDSSEIGAKLHQAALSSGLFDERAIRTRLVRHEKFWVGSGNPENAFVHVTALIKLGRTPEQKVKLGEHLLSAVNSLPEIKSTKRQLTTSVEVTEFDPVAMFRKDFN